MNLRIQRAGGPFKPGFGLSGDFRMHRVDALTMKVSNSPHNENRVVWATCPSPEREWHGFSPAHKARKIKLQPRREKWRNTIPTMKERRSNAAQAANADMGRQKGQVAKSGAWALEPVSRALRIGYGFVV